VAHLSVILVESCLKTVIGYAAGRIGTVAIQIASAKRELLSRQRSWRYGSA